MTDAVLEERAGSVPATADAGLQPLGQRREERYFVDRITDAAGLDAFRRQINELADAAVEPSAASGFAWSSAALPYLPAGSGAVALIWRHSTDGMTGPLRLVGVLPMAIDRPLPGLPLRRVTSWRHMFSFSGVPLIHRDHAADALKAYFRWAFGTEMRASGLSFEHVPVRGPFAEALAEAVAAEGLDTRSLEPHERAVLEVPDDVEAYLLDALPRKRRKEFRRLRARLGEQGALEVQCFGEGDDIGSWLQAFYALEASGWKGRSGTALSCNPAWTGFFDTAFDAFEAQGDALAWKLTLDGAPVAMVIGARSGRQAWLFKIAHDEAHARFSPGVLLILDVMARLKSEGIDFVDSCAQPDHPMINHLWRERLELHDLAIGRPGQPRVLFEALVGLVRFKRSARATAKRLYLKYVKGSAK